jgi:hypothetical protein
MNKEKNSPPRSAAGKGGQQRGGARGGSDDRLEPGLAWVTLFIMMPSDAHVMGRHDQSAPPINHHHCFFSFNNQRGALQAKVSDAIFRNYYMHDAPHTNKTKHSLQDVL